MIARDISAAQVANQAAEAIRTLNYLTLPCDGAYGMRYPCDAYLTLGGLAPLLAARLPQVLRQITDFLGDQLLREQILIDAGEFDGGKDGAVSTAASELVLAATGAAERLERALDRA